jgi:hypothetical protein
VDSRGEPLVTYHASPRSDIRAFEPSADGELGPGVYFTASQSYLDAYRAYLSSYSEQDGHDERQAFVYAAYLSIQNPLKLYGESAQQKFKVETKGKSKNLMRVLKARGFDGIMRFDYDGRELEQIVVFSPKQVLLIED